MAVYTEVSFEEASQLLASLGLGQLTQMAPCSGGIENTNYFVTTDRGEHVLTLFERLSFAQLPFYLKLMKHLAGHGVPVPDPAANARGELVYDVKGKPASVVTRLQGRSELSPTPAHCAAVGAMLARMHLAAASFEPDQPNLRGLPWWNETVPVVLPHIDPGQRQMLLQELAYQNHVAESAAYAALPRGPVHADLFRDNVMFAIGADGRCNTQLTGFFDFYFAGVDTWLFDLAVCLNDWCIDLDQGCDDSARLASFLQAYESVRPLDSNERRCLPAMRRAGALRFWISRLWDFHLPREASLLKPHDPAHFERVLLKRLKT
ncbi:MAG: hypothetical protein RLZZ126_759 [Pseudomonadota bacterium]|jgi:homoserine kinase type II